MSQPYAQFYWPLLTIVCLFNPQVILLKGSKLPLNDIVLESSYCQLEQLLWEWISCNGMKYHQSNTGKLLFNTQSWRIRRNSNIQFSFFYELKAQKLVSNRLCVKLWPKSKEAFAIKILCKFGGNAETAVSACLPG